MKVCQLCEDNKNRFVEQVVSCPGEGLFCGQGEGKQKIRPGNDWFYGCMMGDEKSPPVGGLEGIFSCGLWPLSR